MRKQTLIFLLSLLLTVAAFTGCNLVAIASENETQTGTLPETSARATTVPTTTIELTEDATTGTTSATTAAAETTPTPTTAETTGATTKATTHRTTQAVTTAPINTSSPYYLYAEKGSFTLVVYGKDDAGQFTRVVRTIRMAIGRGTMTPRGRFRLSTRTRWKDFGGIFAQYAVSYKKGLMIHGPLYEDPINTTLRESSYTEIGTKSTSGCLRITTADAYWIYINCPSGTTLDIVESSPRGFIPPDLIPIVVSGQDPTDPGLAPAPTTSTLEPTTTASPEAASEAA
jgi:lipoprotein-anchoring transpeptidase ErfK/SrfK